MEVEAKDHNETGLITHHTHVRHSDVAPYGQQSLVDLYPPSYLHDGDTTTMGYTGQQTTSSYGAWASFKLKSESKHIVVTVFTRQEKSYQCWTWQPGFHIYASNQSHYDEYAPVSAQPLHLCGFMTRDCVGTFLGNPECQCGTELSVEQECSNEYPAEYIIIYMPPDDHYSPINLPMPPALPPTPETPPSPPPAPPSLPPLSPRPPIDNEGGQCWTQCIEDRSSCSYCGGYPCCRSGYSNDPSECNNKGCSGSHCCYDPST